LREPLALGIAVARHAPGEKQSDRSACDSFCDALLRGVLRLPLTSVSEGAANDSTSGKYARPVVPDDIQIEMRDLLKEIRDLLLPVADAHRDEYDRREAIRALLSTDKRKKAWTLADGTLTQRELAKKAGMDEGGASKFFKSLRELDAIADGPNPEKTIQMTP
jgi:hypothetical protein